MLYSAFNKKINILSYNAYRLKSSIDNELCAKDCDIVFICEHWLKPCDISNVCSKYKSQRCWTYFKSSDDPESVLVGRPHGGVGWICKRLHDISYKVMEIDNNRICGIQVISDG